MDVAETDLNYREKLYCLDVAKLTTSYERLNIFIIHDAKESPTHVVVIIIIIVVIIVVVVVIIIYIMLLAGLMAGRSSPVVVVELPLMAGDS